MMGPPGYQPGDPRRSNQPLSNWIKLIRTPTVVAIAMTISHHVGALCSSQRREAA